MRLDKFLWSIRYFKTRSIATEACKQGKVKVNDATAKASREIHPTDTLSIRKNQINYQIKVLDIPPSRVGAKLVSLYYNDITPKEEFEKLELLKYSKEYYRKKGVGRPTKKDRRDIDEWLDNPEKTDDEELEK